MLTRFNSRISTSDTFKYCTPTRPLDMKLCRKKWAYAFKVAIFYIEIRNFLAWADKLEKSILWNLGHIWPN